VSKRMLLYRISEAIARLVRKNTSVRFRWVPAHEGIVGTKKQTKVLGQRRVKRVVQQRQH